MPFTLLSHQAAVLPIKLARPHRVSGTALVVGSMAPDFEYFLRGYPQGSFGHTLVGQFVFCLPLTLAVYWLVTRVIAAPLAAHLPDLGDYRLRDYALLESQPRAPRYWWVVAASALLGSFSHILWDSFTHEHGAFVQAIPALRAVLFELHGVPVTARRLLQHGSTLVGAVVTLALMREIGRERLLRRWAAERGATPAVERAPGGLRFWLSLMPFAAAGVVTSVLVMREGWLWTSVGAWISTFLRTSTFTFVGLCVVCALTARRGRPARDPSAAR